MAAYEIWKEQGNAGADTRRGNQTFYDTYIATLNGSDRAELQAAVQELRAPSATEYCEEQWEEWVQCRVRDARKLRPEAALGAEGFMLLKHASQVADFTDDHMVTRRYYRELRVLVAAATGAAQDHVFVEQHTVREEQELGVRTRGDSGSAGAGDVRVWSQRPIQLVHNDFSDRYKSDLLASFRGKTQTTAFHSWEAIAGSTGMSLAEISRSRIVVLNTWRSIDPAEKPVTSMPLAVCDQRTVSHDGELIPTRLAAHALEVYVSEPSSKHRWYYYPQSMCAIASLPPVTCNRTSIGALHQAKMSHYTVSVLAVTRDELLLIKTFDSLDELSPECCNFIGCHGSCHEHSSGVRSTTLHSSFEIPRTIATTSRNGPRRSIEARILVVLPTGAASAVGKL
eukprot:COSAG02_NODE_3338_length_6903_cov_13.687537_2_plen_397_part_00